MGGGVVNWWEIEPRTNERMDHMTMSRLEKEVGTARTAGRRAARVRALSCILRFVILCWATENERVYYCCARGWPLG